MTPPPREPLEALLLYRLSRLVVVAGRMVTRLCEGRFGITRREWRLLVTLASLGPLGSSQLAGHAQLDRARTSKAVGSLDGKGLISRETHAADRRHVTLALTERGRALYDELYPLVSAINAELGAVLDAREASRFDAALVRLQGQADRMLEAAVWPKADRGRRGSVSVGASRTGVARRLEGDLPVSD